MSDLTFLDSLSEKQNQAALQVVQAAKSAGVEPRLALAIAFREGSLNQNAPKGSSGEIGMMQVLPETAKMLGYKPEDLQDPQKNIEIGLKYLKSGIDKFNDPVLAVAGYNAGMNKPYFTDPEKHQLPDSTKQYVKDIHSFGGFTTTPAPEGGASEGDGNNAGAPKPKEDVVPASEADYRSTLAAATGAGLGASAGAVKSLFPGAKGAQASAIAAGAPSVTSNANSPGAKWASKVVGRVAPGAESVAEQAQSWNRAKGQGPVTSRLNSRFGVTEPGQIGKLSVQSVQAPGMAQKVVSGLEDAGKFLTKHRILGGALAGAGAGFGGQEAVDRYKKGDYLGAGIAGAGALGSVASAIPHPLTRGIGTAVGMASPLALSLLDRIHNQPAQAPQPQQ